MSRILMIIIALTFFTSPIVAQKNIPHIYGKVLDVNKTPLSGVRIQNMVNGQSTTTNYNGEYRMNVRPDELYVLRYMHSNEYQPEERVAKLRAEDIREVNVMMWFSDYRLAHHVNNAPIYTHVPKKQPNIKVTPIRPPSQPVVAAKSVPPPPKMTFPNPTYKPTPIQHHHSCQCKRCSTKNWVAARQAEAKAKKRQKATEAKYREQQRQKELEQKRLKDERKERELLAAQEAERKANQTKTTTKVVKAPKVKEPEKPIAQNQPSKPELKEKVDESETARKGAKKNDDTESVIAQKEVKTNKKAAKKKRKKAKKKQNEPLNEKEIVAENSGGEVEKTPENMPPQKNEEHHNPSDSVTIVVVEKPEEPNQEKHSGHILIDTEPTQDVDDTLAENIDNQIIEEDSEVNMEIDYSIIAIQDPEPIPKQEASQITSSGGSGPSVNIDNPYPEKKTVETKQPKRKLSAKEKKKLAKAKKKRLKEKEKQAKKRKRNKKRRK